MLLVPQRDPGRSVVHPICGIRKRGAGCGAASAVGDVSHLWRAISVLSVCVEGCHGCCWALALSRRNAQGSHGSVAKVPSRKKKKGRSIEKYKGGLVQLLCQTAGVNVANLQKGNYREGKGRTN